MGETVEVRSFRIGAKFRYLIRNIQNLEISVTTPVSSTPIPTSADNSTILTKAEGNTLRITVSWVIHDEPSTVDVVKANPYNTAGSDVGGGTTPTGFATGSLSNAQALRLADNQVEFLMRGNTTSESGFQPTQLEEVYQIILGESGISRVGMIESMTFTKSGTNPVNWNASIAFVAGTNPLAT